jgi:outer membrane protein
MKNTVFCVLGMVLNLSGLTLSPAQRPTTPTLSSTGVPYSPAAGKLPAQPCQRIGFVDMDVVLQESRAVRERIDHIESALDARRREIERKTSEYRRLAEGLERQGSILTDEEKTNRRRRMQQLSSEIEDLRYEANKTLRASERGVIGPVLDAVMATVEEVGRREGFDLIVRGEAVLYGHDMTDLTQRVIDELDLRGLKLPPPEDGLSVARETGQSPEERATRAARASDSPTSGPARSRRPASSIPVESLPLIP